MPKINTHIGAQYSMPISIGKVTLRADYAYQSKRYFFTDVAVNPLNDAIAAKGEHLVSARLSLADVAIGNGTATFSLFGENLLDQTLRPAGIDFGPSLGFAGINFGVPRTWGVEASFKF